MSGGSYNYLFEKSAGEFGPDNDDFLAMLNRLDEVGYAPIAAADTRLILTKLGEIQALIDGLGAVWKAVEWCDSSDTGPDTMRTVLTGYEAEHQKGERS